MKLHKITKIKPTVNFQVTTAVSHDEYRESLIDDIGLSPNVDYWVIGEILDGPIIGESLRMFRYIRNDVEIPGVFATSPITEITENGFKKMNSVYLMETVPKLC